MKNKNSMPAFWWIKSVVILFVLAFGLAYTIPTFLGNPVDWPRDNQGKPTQWMNRFAENFLPSSRVNLGLDLKGGLSLTLNVQVDQAVRDSIARALSSAKEAAALEGIKTGPFRVQDDFSARIQIENPAQAPILEKKITDQSLLILFDRVSQNELIFQPNKANIDEYKKQVMRQAIGTIRNRIDQFGVAEPNIFQAGDTDIVVELPGMADIERAKQLIGNTAQLDFRMVLNNVSQENLPPLLTEARKALSLSEEDASPATVQKIAEWLREKEKIPQNATILLQRVYGTGADAGKVITTLPYLVELHPQLTGDLVEDAQVGQTTENYIPQYAVSLKFKPQGARLFSDMTTRAFEPQNAPHQIAIVLDGNVQSAPVVNGPITGGNASITMGNTTNLIDQMKQAQDLALVLRAGALPASVKVIEERQIGPSEGAQNIHAGVVSTLIAAVLVVVVMLLIYGMAGFVANIAMLLNVILIFALMALFGATLTLPGIAGIVLTMAIAVDGNVVINERIREEIRSGSSQKKAFYKGYSTSLRTLIDAHVTSAVAGFVLVIYGNPTVKGFAITLLCGIVCTLFTSYYVTEVIGQWIIEKTRLKRFG